MAMHFMHGYAWLVHPPTAPVVQLLMVDLNRNHDQVLKEPRRRTGRHDLNTCTRHVFRDCRTEFGNLFPLFGPAVGASIRWRFMLLVKQWRLMPLER
jgi:hypothetical protein